MASAYLVRGVGVDYFERVGFVGEHLLAWCFVGYACHGLCELAAEAPYRFSLAADVYFLWAFASDFVGCASREVAQGDLAFGVLVVRFGRDGAFRDDLAVKCGDDDGAFVVYLDEDGVGVVRLTDEAVVAGAFERRRAAPTVHDVVSFRLRITSSETVCATTEYMR